MNDIYKNLGWLPSPPDDFGQIVSEVSTLDSLAQLSKFSLDANQLGRLYKKFKLLYEKEGQSPLHPFTLGIISNATTGLMPPSIISTALRYGLALKVIETEFNQVAQEAFSSESVFYSHSLDGVLIAIDHRGLPLTLCPGDLIEAEKQVKTCINYVRSVISSMQEKHGTLVIVQNIAQFPDEITGSYEERLPGTLSWFITNINIQLNSLVGDQVTILDVNGLAAKIGYENWHDPKLWNLAKLSFSQTYLPIYAEYICRILGSILGKSSRCLILDLDNTLWGGVIGDDGLDGILIGNGNATGEAHLDLQRTILNLHSQGIVLAVSSKNEDSIARLPFRNHPDMLLREEHIAIFQANWTDKATNIKAIADTLSLGLGSMVFLDDNPAERMQVRSQLPDVKVPELPDDPAFYPRTLLAAGYFEATTFSAEDSQRPNFYKKNALRAEVLNKSSDMEAYLVSLVMVLTINPFNSQGRARVVQLISKSNQFNLTTRRHSAAQIESMESDPAYFTQELRLTDVFGDNGMIGVVICRMHENFWEIDTWLMSCRVLGRRVEEAALKEIVRQAKMSGTKKIIGSYIPSGRNIIVKDHYLKLGFSQTSEKSGADTWELKLSDYNPKSIPIAIEGLDS